MKRVLFFLGHLDDLEIEWLINNGNKKVITEGEILIGENQKIDNLFIVLSGGFLVKKGNLVIANVGVGEVLGEMSFIESRLPDVDVICETDANIYTISREKIYNKIATDKEFKANFYYAISLFLSNRLRKTTSQMGYGNADESDILDDNVLDTVSKAGQRFSEILKKFNDV